MSDSDTGDGVEDPCPESDCGNIFSEGATSDTPEADTDLTHISNEDSNEEAPEASAVEGHLEDCKGADNIKPCDTTVDAGDVECVPEIRPQRYPERIDESTPIDSGDMNHNNASDVSNTVSSLELELPAQILNGVEASDSGNEKVILMQSTGEEGSRISNCRCGYLLKSEVIGNEEYEDDKDLCPEDDASGILPSPTNNLSPDESYAPECDQDSDEPVLHVADCQGSDHGSDAVGADLQASNGLVSVSLSVVESSAESVESSLNAGDHQSLPDAVREVEDKAEGNGMHHTNKDHDVPLNHVNIGNDQITSVQLENNDASACSATERNGKENQTLDSGGKVHDGDCVVSVSTEVAGKTVIVDAVLSKSQSVQNGIDRVQLSLSATANEECSQLENGKFSTANEDQSGDDKKGDTGGHSLQKESRTMNECKSGVSICDSKHTDNASVKHIPGHSEQENSNDRNVKDCSGEPLKVNEMSHSIVCLSSQYAADADGLQKTLSCSDDLVQHSNDEPSGALLSDRLDSDKGDAQNFGTHSIEVQTLDSSQVIQCNIINNITNIPSTDSQYIVDKIAVKHRSRDLIDSRSVKCSKTDLQDVPLDEDIAESMAVSEGHERSNSNGIPNLALEGVKLYNEDGLLSALDAELEPISDERSQTSSALERQEACIGQVSIDVPNGLKPIDVARLPMINAMANQIEDLKQQVRKMESQVISLYEDKDGLSDNLKTTIDERDAYLRDLHAEKNKNLDNLYIPQLKELEYTIVQQQNGIRSLKDKLASHDAAAKRTVTSLQTELKQRVDQVTKTYEDCAHEKDSMVVKFAQAEQKNLEIQKAFERLQSRLQETTKEKDMLITKIKNMKAERYRVGVDLESKTNNLTAVIKELEKQKEMYTSSEVRIRWAQNKLVAELEGHKETKADFDKMKIKMKEAREETEQIRRDCRAMIRTYQESEEIKSNSLDTQLRKKETELLQQQFEKSDQDEIQQELRRELDSLKDKHKDLMEESKTLRDKVTCLDVERLSNEDMITKFKEIMQKQKMGNKNLQDKIDQLSLVANDFERAQDMIKSLDYDIENLKLYKKDLISEMELCRKRECDLLQLTEKLSSKNAHLQCDNINLNNKILLLHSEQQGSAMENEQITSRSKELEEELSEALSHHKIEKNELETKLLENRKKVGNLTTSLAEEQDENRILKRKNANSVKDLTRQLQQAKKRLELIVHHGDKETGSIGSRNSSTGSLNNIDGNGHVQPARTINHVSKSMSQDDIQQQPDYPVITEQVQVDKQVLIERIVKLQKAHARKNEKLEFMEDHIQHLVDEIRRKNRIIQNYALREETGTLTSSIMDSNKPGSRSERQALVSRKGGIMASVYSSHQADDGMTLDLSLQINCKLQAVLEDTLLKNITIKESLDTLGTEIARLSQENRNLQLQLQSRHH